MPTYQYLSKSRDGRTVKGREFAPSQRELVNMLAHKNLTAIAIKEIIKEERGTKFLLGGKRLKIFDLTILCKQLSTMVKGGVPLIKAIDSIAGETKNTLLKNTLLEMSNYIHGGDTFSESVKRFPHLFSPLFVAIVTAGEKVGALDVMLERLSSYLTARDRINKKIVTAITYPAFILTFFIAALSAMTLFLIPRFKAIYEGFGAKLPGITLVVFGISDFFVRNILFILIGASVAVFLCHYIFFKMPNGRLIFDIFILKMPIFGEVMRKASVTKFARTLATLLAEGIPVTESIELVGKTSGNLVIENASMEASKSILNGENIPQALKKTGVFPTLLLQMAQVGVDSGSLPELLDKTADFYEDQVDLFVSIMTALIEPILIVVLGLSLGVAIVAMYYPIFQLGPAIAGRGG